MKLAVIIFSFSLLGQNWVETQVAVKGTTATVTGLGLFTKPANEKWGTFAWVQVRSDYTQAYAGATYKPKPWLQLALGVGAEQDKNPFRIGSYAYFGKGGISSLAVFETGGSGFWYKVETNYKIKSGLGIGTLSNHYRGHGPRLEYVIPHSRALLWFSPLCRRGGTSLTVGVRWKL